METQATTSKPEQLEIRIHGEPPLPTLVYLPGLHGDWTLITSFRRALGGRVRFVEITYPRTLSWDLNDYAAGVEEGLAEKGITNGWLLAESFSSQVAWPMLDHNRFRAQGLILAGGFARHPIPGGVLLAEKLCGEIPLKLLTRILLGYSKVARFRFRHAPETLASLEEFIARRTELDRQAARHRLHLLLENNPCAIAQKVEVPVYALSGAYDPVVPWIPVRRWLKKNCPRLRGYKVLWNADHNVLGTAPVAAAEQVLTWITQPPKAG
jgi:pimeloyl-ACP methyl ester carboxylesterase